MHAPSAALHMGTCSAVAHYYYRMKDARVLEHESGSTFVAVSTNGAWDLVTRRTITFSILNGIVICGRRERSNERSREGGG